MKKNNLARKVTLMITLGTFLVAYAKAQTTTLGIGAGTGGTTNVNIGKDAGKVSTGNSNTFLGYKSGKGNTTGSYNTFVGLSSGSVNTLGNSNTFIGRWSGSSNTSGSYNTFIGMGCGYKNTTASSNTAFGNSCFSTNTVGSGNSMFGNWSGNANTTGNNNCFFGTSSGTSNQTGSNNLYLGNSAGANNIIGNNNVFIGKASGQNELGSEKLYIANSNTTTPLIYGEFDNQKLVFNGKVGINTSTFPSTVGTVNVSTYGLFVKGGILTEEVRVRSGWADYVFNDNYKLMPLNEVETYITDNNHLPNVPTAKEVETEGLSLGEMAKIQQEKIEELTLYIINLNKKLEAQETKINALQHATNK